MTKLTQAQTDLLQAAAATSKGIDDADRRTAAALIKRGFAISLPLSEGGSRLMITAAGQEAVRTASPPVETEGTSGAQAETAEPETTTATALRPTPKGKLGILVEMLRRPEGARVDQMSEATGWQVHSVRGAISGSVKKTLGLTVTSDKTEAGRVYRIVDEAAA